MYLGKDSILSRIHSYDIFEELFEDFTLDYAIHSPFRDDNKPSFAFFENDDAEIMYKDFGDGNSGDVFKFFSILYDISYQEVYEMINSKFELGLIKRPTSLDLDELNNIDTTNIKHDFDKISKRQKVKHDVSYIIEYRPLDPTFYSKYNIGLNTMEKHVKQAQKIFKQKGKQITIEYQYNKLNPCFVYTEKYKGKEYHKLYRPYTKSDDKFRNNYPYGVIENYNNIPAYGNVLIITKSKKDIMVLEELGYDCISPTSENSYTSILELKDELSSRFKYIVVYTDNDEAGVKASIKLTQLTGWYYINNPKTEPKDPSDYSEKYGLQELSDLIESKLEKIIGNEHNAECYLEDESSPF